MKAAGAFRWTVAAAIVAVVLGATLVFTMFPRKDEEERLLAQYRQQDAARS